MVEVGTTGKKYSNNMKCNWEDVYWKEVTIME